MDNFRFNVVWQGEKTFRILLAMLIDRKGGKKFEYFRIDERENKSPRLILYCYESKKANKLPYPMTPEALIDFAWNWLQTVDYGRQPDHDGDNGKGWHLYTEDWGHVDGDWAAFCAIEPAWAMYGK